MNRYQKNVFELLGLPFLSFLVFLSFLFMSFQVKAISYQQGEVLTVVAHSGLSLRDKPGVHHETLLVIPFGHEVERLHMESEAVGDQLGYVPGEWIYVDYHGLKAYVFDGYVSTLGIAEVDETEGLHDLSVPEMIHDWAIYHLDPIYTIDSTITCEIEDPNHLLEEFVDQQYLRVLMNDHMLKSILVLNDVRMMDVYHLVMSMLSSRAERNEFIQNTVIIHNEFSEISEIKVQTEVPIRIKMLEDGRVKVQAHLTLDHVAFN